VAGSVPISGAPLSARYFHEELVMTKSNTKEPSPDELYKKLEEMNLAFEVVESFEGVRVISFLVEESDDDLEN
jgi:hypothetical protein